MTDPLPLAPWVVPDGGLAPAPWLAEAKPITAGGIIGAATDIPVIGPMLRQQAGSIMAAAAPALGGDETMQAPTFLERYQKIHSKLLEGPVKEFAQQHPVAAFGAGLPGTVAGSLALPGSGIVGGAAMGGGISALDAALRGENPVTAGATGAAFGAAAPVVVRGVTGALTGRAASAATPTVEELKDAARAGYAHPEVAAVQIKPQAVTNLSAQIQNDLVNDGFRPITTPKAFSLVGELNVPAGAKSVDMASIDSAQKALRKVASEVDAVGRPTADSAAARTALDRIDGFLGNLKQPDLLAGDASKAVPILRDAGKDWGAAMRAEDIGVRLTRAERQAAKSGVGGNVQNAIKQKVSAVLDVPQRSVGYSDAERAAAEAVVRGTRLENTLRYLGHVGPGSGLGLGLHTMSALGTHGASIPVSVALGAAGLGVKKVAEKMTQAKANRLEEMLRQRSPLYQQRTAAAPPSLSPQQQVMLQTLLRTQSLRGGSPVPLLQQMPLYFPGS